MKATLVPGIALIVMGASFLVYDHYSHITTERILQIGSLTATVERTHTAALPPLLAWLLVGGGACALAFGAWSRKN